MDSFLRRLTMRITMHEYYDTAVEVYYFTKAAALEAAESAEEFRQVVMDMLQTAAALGKQWALKMTKMLLEFLQPATELGGKWAEIALDALAQYWGFARGDGERAASDVFEVELAEIFARHSSSSSSNSNSSSPYPTE